MSFAKIHKQTKSIFHRCAGDLNRNGKFNTCQDPASKLEISFFLNFFFLDRDLHIFSRNDSQVPREFPRRPVLSDEEREKKDTPMGGSEAPHLSSQDHQGGNNILIYVSVLAAVVLGLLIYVAYKW